MTEKDPTLEAWRSAIASAVGCDVSKIKTVKELLECKPIGACEAHERCWTHSEARRCGSLIQSVSSDPCEGFADGSDGLCSGCREFKALCEQHDAAVNDATMHICGVCFQPSWSHRDPGYWPPRCCHGCPCGTTRPASDDSDDERKKIEP